MMSNCDGCGGVIGRDCYNPQECRVITALMIGQGDAYNEGYQAATAHYQPLLEAKDAEIARMDAIIGEMQPIEAMITLREQNTNLKALLEQAREGLEESECQCDGGQCNRCHALDVINAASQNSKSFNGNQTCETSSDTTGEK